jgi:hypothetical protein
MNDYDELVQRLRDPVGTWMHLDTGIEAADAIAALQALVAELEAECKQVYQHHANVEGERDNWAALCAATGEDLRECKADLAAARALLRESMNFIASTPLLERIDKALAGKDAP